MTRALARMATASVAEMSPSMAPSTITELAWTSAVIFGAAVDDQLALQRYVAGDGSFYPEVAVTGDSPSDVRTLAEDCGAVRCAAAACSCHKAALQRRGTR